MKRALLLAVVVLVALGVAGTQAAAFPETAPECPASGPLHTGILQSQRVPCAKARKLVLRFMGQSQFKGPRFRVLGFVCSNVPPKERPGVLCRRGAKQVRFLGYPAFFPKA